MGPYDDITFFTKYQTFLVGLLGFLGVMATLWWNDRLARRARAAAAAHECTILRIAMIEELKLVQRAFELRVEQFSEVQPVSFSYVPKRLPVALYDRLADRIGVLSRKEVAAVMHAYGLIQQLPERLRLIIDPAQDQNPDFFLVPSSRREMLRGIHESYLKIIAKAVETLEAKVDAAEH